MLSVFFLFFFPVFRGGETIKREREREKNKLNKNNIYVFEVLRKRERRASGVVLLGIFLLIAINIKFNLKYFFV